MTFNIDLTNRQPSRKKNDVPLGKQRRVVQIKDYIINFEVGDKVVVKPIFKNIEDVHEGTVSEMKNKKFPDFTVTIIRFEGSNDPFVGYHFKLKE